MTNEAQQAKEKVLKWWPDVSITNCAGAWEVWDSEAFEGDYAHRLGSSLISKKAAWIAAASHSSVAGQPEAPSVAAEGEIEHKHGFTILAG